MQICTSPQYALVAAGIIFVIGVGFGFSAGRSSARR